MISLFISFLFFTPVSLAGNELGNGGDKMAQEFVAVGRGLVQELKETPDPRIADLEAFTKAVEATQVFTKDSVEKDGHKVDALNFPEHKRIELSRERWPEYDRQERRALVLHEYLGICCANDTNYEISSTYADASSSLFKPKLGFDVQLRSGYSGPYDGKDRPDRPSFGGSVGYQLSPRSTLSLGFDSHRFAEEVMRINYYGERYNLVKTESLLEFHASYKYWFNPSSRLRPYAAGGLGYAISKYSENYANDFAVSSQEWNTKGAYVIGKITGGLNYRVSRSVGLDLSVNLHGLQAIERYSNDFTGIYDAQLGLNFFL